MFAKGSQWKAARSCLSQFFTSSKLRAVMPSLLNAQQQLVGILGEHADSGEEVDINSLCERFTFDVICKAAFSLDTNVQRNPENPLFKKAITVVPNVNSGFLYHLGQNLYQWPWLLSLPIKVLIAFCSNPLADMTNKAAEIIMYRRINPQVRVPDMAQILLDNLVEAEGPEVRKYAVPKEGTAHLPAETLNRLASNCMVVFIGGSTSRSSDEDYRYGKYVIKKGTSVMVPTYQLHHDPEYWNEPEKFDPERFSPEKKHSFNPTAYQPFGLGPRMCPGQRLVLVELVSAAAEILRHYSIALGRSQKRDLELRTYAIMAAPKEKVFIRLRRIQAS
ncbi:hypothetical protein HPB50_027938 [Hyalomma asiaticum]|nr:hypothetical protein HPB50_027938 [Hyalomma asiaticum]